MNEENIESVMSSVSLVHMCFYLLCQWFPHCGWNACTVYDVLNGLGKTKMNSDGSNEVVV